MAKKYLSRWEPFRDLVSLRTDFDRLFNTFFDNMPTETERLWAPAVDIEENNGNLVVKAELPGMEKEDITVSVRDNMLHLSGERKIEKETKDKSYHRIERCFGKFSRTIELPAAVEADKVKAVYIDGVLNITLPKPEELKPKKIDVEVK